MYCPSKEHIYVVIHIHPYLKSYPRKWLMFSKNKMLTEQEIYRIESLLLATLPLSGATLLHGEAKAKGSSIIKC